MPEISFPTEWLKINENVNNGDHIKFLNAGVLDGEKDAWEFDVQVYKGKEAGVTKKFNLNKTNFKAISALYGTNSDNWVGKFMRIEKVKARNPQLGTMVDSILLIEPNTAKDSNEPKLNPETGTPTAMDKPEEKVEEVPFN